MKMKLATVFAFILAVAADPQMGRTQSSAPHVSRPDTISTKSIGFDVVSIRENKSGNDMTLGKSVPDGISLENASLPQFIAHAYGVDHGMGTNFVSGLPHWAEVRRYDIQLKVAAEDVPSYRRLKSEQVGLMLQAVLADRFKLAAHMGTKEAPTYNLLVAKGGPRMRVSDPTDNYPNGIKMSDGTLHGAVLVERGHIVAQQATISSLLFMFTDFSGRPVIDRTGLTGRYDFNLRWTPDEHPDDPAQTDDTGPGLFTALEEQLGLKLEPAKGSVQAVFVDHIEPPTEN
jgi:uncharacterized protein (TIGR03435 family)